MESEEEKEARLSLSSPEQPRPSTSKAVSPLPLEGSQSPESHTAGNEELLLNSNPETGDSGEAGREGRAAEAEACMLFSRGWVGPLFCILTTQGAQSQQHSLCPALSCYQTGQGEPTVCLGVESACGLFHQVLDGIPVWGAPGAEVHSSLAPSPNTLLQNLAPCLCTAWVSP